MHDADFDNLRQVPDDALGLNAGIEVTSNDRGYAVIMLRRDDEGNALRLKLDCHCTDVGNAKRFVALYT